MSKVNVTITSDASYGHMTHCGGYAFQIRYGDNLIKKWGPFKRGIHLHNSMDAEIKSILNALYLISKLDLDIYTLTINTDCEFIVEHIFNPKSKWKKFIKRRAKDFNKALSKLNYVNLSMKHVRAHTNDLSCPRRFVNDWCDRHAVMGRKLAEGPTANRR